MEPRIRELAEELVDAFADRGEVDLVAAFAVPLPMTVIAEQLGVGTDRPRRLQAVVGSLRRTDRQRPAERGGHSRDHAQHRRFTQYFLALLEERRREPRDDFVTLLNGTDDPEEDVTEASRLSYIAQLLGAGNETSTKMIGAGAGILARDHALAAELRAAPERIPAFAEEVLRPVDAGAGPVPHRTRDTELAGIPIPAGSHVVVWYAGGNRDLRSSAAWTTSTSTATTSADTSPSGAGGTTVSARRSVAPRV